MTSVIPNPAVESFPINEEILSQIENQEAIKKKTICKEHEKESQFICLTYKKVICNTCVQTIHKPHDFKKIKEVIEIYYNLCKEVFAKSKKQREAAQVEQMKIQGFEEGNENKTERDLDKLVKNSTGTNK